MALLSKVTMCSPRQHRKKKPMVIMSAMYISFAVLEAQHALTAKSISLTGSGSTQVGGGWWYFFFVGLKVVF